MSVLMLNLTVAGVLLVGLGVLHIALPAVLGWRRELAGASPLNREVSYVHCFFTGLACVLWGLLPLAAGRLLLEPGSVARLVLIGAVAFWGCRLAIQLLVFNRHARESAAWLVLSLAGTGLWLYLTAVWAWALCVVSGGRLDGDADGDTFDAGGIVRGAERHRVGTGGHPERLGDLRQQGIRRG